MKKGVSIGIIFLIILGVIITVLVLGFSLNIFGKSRAPIEDLGNATEEQVEDPCFRAKTFLNINPNKACSILLDAGKCSCYYSCICNCGDFCIKCNYYGKYLGSC